MQPRFDESNFSRLLDGDLPPQERRLLENYLNGSQEAVAKYRQLLKTRDLVRSLPRRNCPVDMVSIIRAKREAIALESSTTQRSLFRALLRVGAVAAVLALVFALVFEPGVPRRHSNPASPLTADIATGQQGFGSAMKVSTISYDIIDRGYQTEVNTNASGVSVSIARKFPNSITFHMTNPDSEPGKLRELIRNLNMSAEYLVGYGKPVYRIKGQSASVLADFLDQLIALDPDTRVDNSVQSFIETNDGSLLDIHFVVRLVKR